MCYGDPKCMHRPLGHMCCWLLRDVWALGTCTAEFRACVCWLSCMCCGHPCCMWPWIRMCTCRQCLGCLPHVLYIAAIYYACTCASMLLVVCLVCSKQKGSHYP